MTTWGERGRQASGHEAEIRNKLHAEEGKAELKEAPRQVVGMFGTLRWGFKLLASLLPAGGWGVGLSR